MRYLLGIDFGGGSSKATLLSEAGKVICTSECEYPVLLPHSGWVEQEPESIFSAFLFNVRTIIAKSGVPAKDIQAVALDGGTHIAVLLDKNDAVIRPAIYWSDNRNAKQAALLESYREEIMAQSYNVPSTLWTLPQLMWIRENEPENFKRINKILFLKDYIRFRITGRYVTDSIDAMGSMLYDCNNNRWSDMLCKLCGLSPEQLPEIVESGDIVGSLTSEACVETNLHPDTLVVAGATDTVMELYASGAIAVGQSTLKLATAGRICVVTDKPYADPMLVCYKHIIPGLWYPGTATKSCASSMRWYRDVFGEYEQYLSEIKGKCPYKIIDEAASSVPPGSDGLFFHPYLQGEITPYFDSHLKASFTGASSFHTKGHFNRAVMEGVSYSLKGCMEVLNSMGITPNETVRIIGGGSKSQLWCQIVADVIGIPLVKVNTDDSSLGSAMLAGVASGVFSSYEQSVELCTSLGDTIYPDLKNRMIYEEGFSIYKRIHDALAPIYREISK